MQCLSLAFVWPTFHLLVSGSEDDHLLLGHPSTIVIVSDIILLKRRKGMVLFRMCLSFFLWFTFVFSSYFTVSASSMLWALTASAVCLFWMSKELACFFVLLGILLLFNSCFSTAISSANQNSWTESSQTLLQSKKCNLLSQVTAKQYSSRHALLSSTIVAWSPVLHSSANYHSSNSFCSSCSILATGGKSGNISFWRICEPPCYTIEHGRLSADPVLIGLLQAHNSWVTAISWAISSASSLEPQLILSTGSYDGRWVTVTVNYIKLEALYLCSLDYLPNQYLPSSCTLLICSLHPLFSLSMCSFPVLSSLHHPFVSLISHWTMVYDVCSN